jgi:hypothetical protein
MFRLLRDHHRNLVGRRIDDHDIVLHNDLAEGRNLRNLRYQGSGEDVQLDATRYFSADGKADAQLSPRSILGHARVDQVHLLQ